MSIHVQLTPEAQAKLIAQQRKSTVLSLIISALTLALLAMLLYVVLLKPMLIEVPTIVTYQGAAEVDEDQVTKKKVSTQIQNKPSSPSTSMARVIASTSPSSVSIPVPEVNTPDPSADFGDRADFGAGWGEEEEAFGAASFFGQSVEARRMAFVIDYSASMRGSRDNLMRKELIKSLDSLVPGVEYTLIFFAGPAWVAGDEFVLNKDQKGCVIKGRDGETYKWEAKSRLSGYEPKGKKRKADWLRVSSKQLKESREIVDSDPLVPGTNWLPALTMALEMDPPPQVINFMTDGSTGKADEVVAEVSKLSSRKGGVIINCVALMDPQAKAGMMKLAKATGGQFTIVEKDGTVIQVPLGDEEKKD